MNGNEDAIQTLHNIEAHLSAIRQSPMVMKPRGTIVSGVFSGVFCFGFISGLVVALVVAGMNGRL